MGTSYNAQLCRGSNEYKIQFETDNYDLFKLVEKACQKAVDEKDKAVDEKDKVVMKERASRMRVLGHL